MPNDPSSPTPDQNATPSPTTPSGVGCSAWLGDVARDAALKVIEKAKSQGGLLYKGEKNAL